MLPQITKIQFNEQKKRYWIFVDGEYCTSIRERTFDSLNFKVGDKISCEEIKEKEKFFFKNLYANSWEREKFRLKKVCELIEKTQPLVKTNIIGFGASSTKFISEHPQESGKPDIEVVLKSNNAPLLLVEVSGTEKQRGNSYWVRPDKLKYAENHLNEDVWIILHFAEPENFIFIKPEPGKKYPIVTKKIRDIDEYYVEFYENSSEVISSNEFFDLLQIKCDSFSPKT